MPEGGTTFVPSATIPSTRKNSNLFVLIIGTLTWIAPFEPTLNAVNPGKLVDQGPDRDDAQATVAVLPGKRLVQVSTPLFWKEVIRIFWPKTG